MPVSCPRCHAFLPPLPGADEYALIELAELMRENLIESIKRVRELSSIGLAEAKRYVDCPHLSPLPQPPAPPRALDGPVHCPSCSRALPPIDATPTQAHQLQVALGNRRVIEAIKIVREITNAGLREARDYVECPHASVFTATAAPLPAHVSVLCPTCRQLLPSFPGATAAGLTAVHAALVNHNKIVAIKHVREMSGWGLKESKDYVDCPHHAR
jgi:ribosomal protein L7/L12